MKSRLQNLFLFILAVSLLPFGRMEALYNGNPSFPMMPEQGLFFKKDAWVTIKAGYEWDDVIDRNLTVHEHRPRLKREVKDYAAMGNFGSLTLGCNDRVELYGLFGAEEADIHYRPYSDVRLKFQTHQCFAWTVGGRAILAYWGDTQLGIDAKYFQFNPHIHSLKLNGKSLHPEGAFYHYREWQVGLGVSHRIKLFIPYAGLKYSDVRAKFHHLKALSWIFPDKHFTMKNKHPMGVFLGLGLSFDRALNINFEARLYDETGITASADIRF
ncbi:MAG: hypothetical protein JSR39_09890 [Verrucomicrobia bacterium]|nr:hypothetical protein [Verrucomicrobiota bacterium]